MTGSSLQEKIDKLQNTVHALLHKSHSMECVYIDDIARLNKEIHEQVNDLSLLMGYSVSVYANSEDEVKKRAVLRRSQEIMKKRLPSPLKIQLHTIYDKLLS